MISATRITILLIFVTSAAFGGVEDGLGATTGSLVEKITGASSSVSGSTSSVSGSTSSQSGSASSGNFSQGTPQPPSVLTHQTAPTATAIATQSQVQAAKAVAADPFNIPARMQYNQATAAATAFNSKLDELVKSGQYSNKGLNEFRGALAAQLNQPTDGLVKKGQKEPENKPVKLEAPIADGQGTILSNRQAPKAEAAPVEMVFTPKEAAALVRERILEDLKRSQFADPNAKIIAPSLLNGQAPKEEVKGTSEYLIRQVENLKGANVTNGISEVPSVGSPSIKIKNEGRLLFDPARHTADAGPTESTPEISQEHKEKIKAAAKEYLDKIAKAPNSSNEKDLALQQAVRTAKGDENVYDGLLNEIATAFESDRLSRVSSYKAENAHRSPVEANPILSGRNPASLDEAVSDAVATPEINPQNPFAWPSSQTKIPVLVAMAIFLAVLVFWSSQSKPRRRG